MKSKKTLKDELLNIRDQDIKDMRVIIEDLDNIIKGAIIKEASIYSLENIITQLTTMKNNYMWRLFRICKQNHML